MVRRIKNKLQKKWGIQSNWDFWAIMIVFSLAGLMISVCRPPIFHFLGIEKTPLWLKIIIYLPLMVPLYQIFLLLFGFLFGQFSFFWEKEKRMGRWILQRIQSFIL